MIIGNGTMSQDAIRLWDKRAEVLEAGHMLMQEKPDPEQWTEEERRIWRYATAISARLDKLN
ncbi:MAG: hypothetical protein RLZ98_1305 [Pseudomonadota bacterium]|jgi:hypothetical protein